MHSWFEAFSSFACLFRLLFFGQLYTVVFFKLLKLRTASRVLLVMGASCCPQPEPRISPGPKPKPLGFHSQTSWNQREGWMKPFRKTGYMVCGVYIGTTKKIITLWLYGPLWPFRRLQNHFTLVALGCQCSTCRPCAREWLWEHWRLTSKQCARLQELSKYRQNRKWWKTVSTKINQNQPNMYETRQCPSPPDKVHTPCVRHPTVSMSVTPFN